MSDGLQPFLTGRVAALCAPTQVWSARSGDIGGPGGAAIDGVYHGDTRFLREVTVAYGPDAASLRAPESVSVAERDAAAVGFTALLRSVDDETPDPKVRLERTRRVADGRVAESLEVRSHLSEPVDVTLRVTLRPDFAPLQGVKAGSPAGAAWEAAATEDGVRVTAGGARLDLSAPRADVRVADGGIELTWRLRCPARGASGIRWEVRLDDPSLVVHGVSRPAGWTLETPTDADPRLRRWLDRALSDLSALRLALPDRPADVFLAAGAPWFLTLFGRDSLWAARLLLPVDAGVAASTLRILARLQGTRVDPERAEQPGKILHELRAGELSMPGEGIVLPPLYYGTVDATPLWVCLLADAAPRLPEDEVRALLPALRAALGWIVDSAGEGFLDYVDESGRGLSNQGWKDSGDSIQWRDGRLAAGPIALCEVQGYAYEAAVGGAALLDALGEPGGEELRAWAERLKRRFRERFWVDTPEGRYPAIALDRDGRAVDTLTSNIGHLLGTGILDPAEEADVARVLTGPSMASGFGIRTMSTDAAGYWPLSYHGGSVWAHDTAIVAHGMLRAGLVQEARTVVAGLLRAAEAFEFRVPELYAGDALAEAPAPAPYPAACRPQAWSAAAAVVCAGVLAAG
jgi:hypothetical protein